MSNPKTKTDRPQPRRVGKIVHMPLFRTDKFAILDKDDYDRLAALGYGKSWYLNADGKGRYYVRVSVPGISGGLANASRLITNAEPGKCIDYRDRNRLNLRRSNLNIRDGFAKHRTLSEAEAVANDRAEARGRAQ